MELVRMHLTMASLRAASRRYLKLAKDDLIVTLIETVATATITIKDTSAIGPMAMASALMVSTKTSSTTCATITQQAAMLAESGHRS